MKIAVIGVGAMGSVYAALLAAAGNDVWAIDTWADHLDAIRQNGLRVEGASGDRIVTSYSRGQRRCGVAGECDLYIVATKASGVEAAARCHCAGYGKAVACT
jgi:2-dehydropantoate 2-reductase